ncbi:Serine/threonine-protein kinase AfsK [Streptomyces sp. YIM 130001]|uniref:serine/threonine-protein kinase n=1 Tax=Streptomyces sp. YIM 130001 TaxID=2259644 RepID=UPI000E6487EA|nr:serine/threonine-protein kinase [Streptomyces sp. YIM 130001]RII09162.1 Serine/threonine-protein kinase AfsK [Streptomyces sp. YIM 130001]
MDKLGPTDPQRIGAYRLIARLGAGGMGQVYLARSARGRTVAVKLVRQELAEQEEFRARFRQEVRAARQVGGRWTAPVLDADTEAPVPWVATGYVVGPSLGTVVSRDHGPLPERSTRILAAGLAHALQDIHAAGLVHRDLKPSNVLVTIDGPRVIDFGIARALETVTDGGLTRTGALVGSPGFMAPEQVRGDRITPACDVFCLGSVLAFAASGVLPFGTATSGVHALMFRIAQEDPDLSELPESLQELVADCLAKDPERRPSLETILERTDAEGTVDGGRTGDPWLPGVLVAQLGRHAVELLDSEGPDDLSAPEPQDAANAGAAARAEEAAAAPVDGRSAAGEPADGAPSDDGPASARESDDREGRDRPGEDRADGTGTPGTPADNATPPPPGTPGAAPVDHLPTMAAGSAPPPGPPPGAAAAGAPYPGGTPTHGPAHAQGIAYGYPHPQGAHGHPNYQSPRPPYGPDGWGTTSPYGHTPPYGPPPPRRSGRSTAVLVAVALVVAIGAGGAVYALMQGDDGRTGAGAGSSQDPKQRGDASPGSDGGGRSPAPESPSPSDSPSGAGTVPERYIGTWRASFQAQGGANTRVMTIVQGDTDDVVMTLDGKGPNHDCRWEATLRSGTGDELTLGPSSVIRGDTGSCQPGQISVLHLRDADTLERELVGSGGDPLTYRKD